MQQLRAHASLLIAHATIRHGSPLPTVKASLLPDVYTPDFGQPPVTLDFFSYRNPANGTCVSTSGSLKTRLVNLTTSGISVTKSMEMRQCASHTIAVRRSAEMMAAGLTSGIAPAWLDSRGTASRASGAPASRSAHAPSPQATKDSLGERARHAYSRLVAGAANGAPLRSLTATGRLGVTSCRACRDACHGR